MSLSAARVRWKEGEKEEMIALRKKHPELTIAQFTERFYPHRTAKAMGQTLWMFNQMAKVEARQKEKEKRSQNDDQVGKSLDAGATTPSATTTADTFSNSDDEEDSNPDDPNEDIGWEREQTPSKRIKLTYSTRSRTSLNSSRDSAVLRSRSSEYPGSSLKSTPILSPQVGGRHSTASIAEQASHDQDAQTNTFNTTPVLSPPALAPAPPPPPPPPQQQQQQIAEEQTQPAQLDTIEKQSDQLQPQTSQASEDTVKQDNITSPSEIRRQFAQQNAALYPLLEMALSRSEASETEKLRIENELIALQKEYESTRADKERQIAQLQGELDRCRNERDEWLNGRKELDRLVIENENLRSRLRKVFADVADAAHGL